MRRKRTIGRKIIRPLLKKGTIGTVGNIAGRAEVGKCTFCKP